LIDYNSPTVDQFKLPRSGLLEPKNGPKLRVSSFLHGGSIPRNIGHFNRSFLKHMSLEFHKISNLHCRMTLNSGVQIILNTINQHYTYQNLLMGAPDHASNDLIIEYDLNSSAALCEAGSKPVLIPPDRRNF